MWGIKSFDSVAIRGLGLNHPLSIDSTVKSQTIYWMPPCAFDSFYFNAVLILFHFYDLILKIMLIKPCSITVKYTVKTWSYTTTVYTTGGNFI